MLNLFAITSQTQNYNNMILTKDHWTPETTKHPTHSQEVIVPTIVPIPYSQIIFSFLSNTGSSNV